MILIGILAIWVGLAAIVVATVAYTLSMRAAMKAAPVEAAPAGNGKRKNGAAADLRALEAVLDRKRLGKGGSLAPLHGFALRAGEGLRLACAVGKRARLPLGEGERGRKAA